MIHLCSISNAGLAFGWRDAEPCLGPVELAAYQRICDNACMMLPQEPLSHMPDWPDLDGSGTTRSMPSQARCGHIAILPLYRNQDLPFPVPVVQQALLCSVSFGLCASRRLIQLTNHVAGKRCADDVHVQSPQSGAMRRQLVLGWQVCSP
jgi:hypothetical protein